MTREMTPRLFMLMQEEHTESAFKQTNGRTMCRKCQATWPCDTALLLTSHKRLEQLLDIVGTLNMQGYGLVEALAQIVRDAPAALNDKAREDELALLAEADEYLKVGKPG